MSLGSSTDSDRAIMAAWEKFLSGNTMPQDAVRRMVEDSWRRCLDQGVSPIRTSAPLVADDESLNSLQRRNAELMEAAMPVMVQAREFLSESATMMILTDPDGVILSVEGDPNAKYNGQGVQLVPGARWEEAATGTNAIGTALAAAQPVQICAAEHFCEGIKRWTCSATVIRDPYDGRILGALDISGLSGSHNTHCLALAVAGAGRIESRLAKIEMEKRARLLDVTLAPTKRWLDGGLIIFDRRGRLVRANENASLFLNNLGLDLGACTDLALTGLTTEKAAQRRTLPEWVKSDWLEAVIDHEERLGTILAIPLSRHFTAKASASSPDAESAAKGRHFAQIIGDSPALNKAKHHALQLAKLHVPVLLLGPTGAGKEVFARVLHNAGSDAARPFVPINCGSMTRDLLASELFGYAEGAFTGAKRGGMVGKFEAADGGTLFLDEIGELPLDLQAHLLRVLEEGEVYRLGENKPRKVRVRVVAATNRNLREEVAAGNFRMDLFYRLAVTVLRLPALAEHKEDIPLLVRHFIDQAVRNYGAPDRRPSPEVLDALMAYPWPGNVRELRNVVEGMVLLGAGDVLTMDDVPPEILAPHAPAAAQAFAPASAPSPSTGRLAESEREAILAAMKLEHGNFTRAARRLGIAKSTFYEKMKRHGIERPEGSDRIG
jgi:transcriptional regulator of acetoin/glycerol metabolism